ncbi:MAG: DUF4153 domain-containing protein [Paludibacteraceae bacterium]|nr:DUF4153 domain-containing protein [Paludibacteraceae bacterium]
MSRLTNTLKHFGEHTQATLRSFPVTLGLLTALTALLIFNVVAPEAARHPRAIPVSIYWLSVLVVLDFGLSLWMEELKNKFTGINIRVGLVLLWTAYCVWLYLSEVQLQRGFVVGNAAWITAFVLLIPFISFWREKDDIKAWHLLLSFALAAIIVNIVVGVMTAGSLGLLAGVGALFDMTISEKLFFSVAVVCYVLLGGFLFLYLTPTGERKHNTDTAIHPFLLSVMKWLIMPLLGCYMVVLYVYMCSIIFHWELPKGTLSVLVSVVMFGLVLTYVVLYPRIKDGNDALAKLVKRWAPILILPLLVLMTVGIGRRIHDYGITAPRLYVLTLNIWYYVICLVILLAPRKRFHWIFLSFAALFLLSSGLPVNYYSISKRAIVGRITSVLEDNNIPIQKDKTELYKTLKSTIGKEDAKSILENIDYLHDTYQYNGMTAWMEKYDSGDRYVYKYDNNTDEWETVVRYSLRDMLDIYWPNSPSYTCPEGYRTFKEIANSGRSHDTIPAILVEDSVLPVVWHPATDSVIIRFDIKEIIRAKEAKRELALRAISCDSTSTPKDALFLPSYITIEQIPDSVYTVDYSGYLFEK